MKKLLAVILAALLLLIAGTVGVFAVRNGAGKGYADADCDGVCDNTDTKKYVCYIDEDDDGVCDKKEEALKTTKSENNGFVDVDDDGVCDNLGTDSCRGKGCGIKQGAGYIDADNDGMCDNRGTCRRGR